MINRRRGKALTTNIPIYTLSGGVGRQAPSKRLPSESQELLNALVSVERSVEKRPGTDLMGIRLSSTDYTGEDLGLPVDGDFEFFWHSLSDDARYLIIIDRAATGASDKLYYVFFYNQTNDYFEDHTASVPDQTAIPSTVRSYLTGGSVNVPLRMVSRGQNLVFLNPDIEAGYLTTGDGAEIASGYTTALKVDPQGLAVYWDSYSNYAKGAQVLVVPGVTEIPAGATVPSNGIEETEDEVAGGAYSGPVQEYYILQAQTTIAADSPITSLDNWVVVSTDAITEWDAATAAMGLPLIDYERAPVQIAVKDFEYPDSTKPQLGQSLPTFNDLRLPPLASDVSDGNNGAEALLASMYDLTTSVTPGSPIHDSADGKVYYIQTGYQGQAPGYYLMKDVDAPHTLKIRTPDAYSVLDNTTMPVQLEFVGDPDPTKAWNWDLVDWAPRTSGDLTTNPGPTPFKNGRVSKISTIAFFRNRLWMSSGDVIFSSREGDFTDLWLEDPGVIVDTDPIDIAASTNTFTPITSMVPFKEYMFVNTNADTQYELLGSENQITPFTAELQPMTFYSTAPLVDPLTLGNNIFFFDAERLYLYLGRGGTLSTAAELSSHCPKYLPRNYGATSVAAAQDTILAVDADAKSEVYLYTTRYRGEQVLQNAFYKFVYANRNVLSLKSWDNDVYMVTQRDGKTFIERQLMRFDEETVPRVDRKQNIPVVVGSTLSSEDPKFTPGVVNAVHEEALYETTVRIPVALTAEELEKTVFVSETGIQYSIKSSVVGSDYTDLNVESYIEDGSFWFGQTYLTAIQLSTQFVRTADNNPEEGILNIASMVTRHYQTGNYDIISQRRGRPLEDVLAAYEERNPELSTFTTSFVAPRTDTFDESNLSVGNLEHQGELVSKIMGFSDKLEIFILSDYFTPMNITNLQLRGKFKKTYSSII